VSNSHQAYGRPLFKYVTPERTDVLRGGLIRFTAPGDLNDPFDLQPYFDAIIKESELVGDLRERMPEAYEEALRAVYRQFGGAATGMPFKEFHAFLKSAQIDVERAMDEALSEVLQVAEQAMPSVREEFQRQMSRIGILSLASRRDHPLMWSHYAREHQGFVIQFADSHPWFDRRRSSEDEFYHVRDVQYRDPIPQRALTDMSGEDLLLVKGSEWSYEAERRMAAPLECADRIVEVRNGRLHLFQLPAEVVAAVAIGARASDSLVAELSELCRGRSDLSHIRMERARLDPSTRRVLFEPL
jgi:hypothetical protein